MRRNLAFSIPALALLLTAAQAVAAEKPIIYFGVYEVAAGRLKSADGSLPVAGGTATLGIDINGLSQAIACRNQQNCAALEPNVYVRYNSHDSFQSVGTLPAGFISGRGPGPTYYYPGIESNGAYPVELQIPADADRIEVYAVYNRYSYGTANCRLAYDMTECDITHQTFESQSYVSNYGQNFAIPVQKR
jgi:hypothetical protein